MKPTIAFLPGDGIGPEVTPRPRCCVPSGLRARSSARGADRRRGDRRDRRAAARATTLALCQAPTRSSSVRWAGPKWESSPRCGPEQGLLGLRKGARPLREPPARPRYLGLPTPLRGEPGPPGRPAGRARAHRRHLLRRAAREGPTQAVDTWRQTRERDAAGGARRLPLARARRKRVTSVDKANVLETSRLWRRVVTEVAARVPRRGARAPLRGRGGFSSCAAPHTFDVIVTDNMFGDILSRRGGDAGGLHRHAALGLARRGPGPLRARPRLRSRHRRPGHRQPDGRDPDRGDDARARLGRPDLARASSIRCSPPCARCARRTSAATGRPPSSRPPCTRTCRGRAGPTTRKRKQ